MFFSRKPHAVSCDPERLPTVDTRERIYAIGDIHGRKDLLIVLLDRIGYDIEARQDGRKTKLVFLGDYVDRGDESRAVLDALVELSHLPESSAVFLCGNHESMLLRFLEAPLEARAWLDWGGDQTLASYGVTPPSPRATDGEVLDARERFYWAVEPHLPFLESLRSHTVSGSVVFTHAGLKPGVAPHLQDPVDMVWGHRNFLCDLPLPEYRVVHGHYDDSEPVSLPGRLCVDTGAYYSGVLTALRLDASEEFISVTHSGAAWTGEKRRVAW